MTFDEAFQAELARVRGLARDRFLTDLEEYLEVLDFQGIEDPQGIKSQATNQGDDNE